MRKKCLNRAMREKWRPDVVSINSGISYFNFIVFFNIFVFLSRFLFNFHMKNILFELKKGKKMKSCESREVNPLEPTKQALIYNFHVSNNHGFKVSWQCNWSSQTFRSNQHLPLPLRRTHWSRRVISNWDRVGYPHVQCSHLVINDLCVGREVGSWNDFLWTSVVLGMWRRPVLHRRCLLFSRRVADTCCGCAASVGVHACEDSLSNFRSENN